METNETMISFYADSIEKMTGKKVVLVGEEIMDQNGFVEDWDFKIIKKDNYFIGLR